jgi:hypothetical protein
VMAPPRTAFPNKPPVPPADNDPSVAPKRRPKIAPGSAVRGRAGHASLLPILRFAGARLLYSQAVSSCGADRGVRAHNFSGSTSWNLV